MKRVLITGAGSGLGQSLATYYAKEGHNILLVGRRESRLQETKSLIEQDGGTAEIHTCDITKWDELEALSASIKQVDMLINNAGVGYFGAFEQLEKEQIDTMLNVNAAGLIYTTKHFMPHILQSKGRILNIISTAGLRGKVHESGYCASKFAQRGFTESLQKEYEDRDITITAVYMGGMNTPFWDESDYVEDPSVLPSPDAIAEQIIDQDDGRDEIVLEK
ncbi:SDR family NAD(P)-dependent oxidoreductase [Tenuibacillus multivorans]|uniref:Short-chain dehydrogenase n=1 Tax=Tenuibacillus multivorans TaxID=237069 RepID=A0A1H0FYN8_9BACI|nr:SDR family oxidoreductase [Tenuibacillus multivorans]GEL78157.1 3-ketoacyl-ACP reductase [Tenuibacillus multivorans]SDN99691.1 Short-chain dehydrogenase [Tenuibacillus multivorans]